MFDYTNKMKDYDKEHWFEVLEEIFEKDDYEPETKTILKEIASHPDVKVFADIGANVGIFTKIFSGIKKAEGLVFAFEPDPIVLDRLQHNAKKYKKEFGIEIYAIGMAISNKNDIDTLYTSDKLADGICGRLSAGINRDFLEVFKSPLIPVPILLRTIDYFFYDSNQKVDVIKLDVEAEELKAIEGGRKTLEEYRPVVIIEAHMHLNDKVHEMMDLSGYTPYKLDDGRFSCWVHNIDGRWK